VAVRRLVYPLIVGLNVALALLALSREIREPVIAAALQVATMLAVALLERAIPYRPEWNVSKGDVLTDVAFVVSSTLAYSAGELAAKLPFLWVHFSGPWPTSWPLLAQLGPALVVAELGCYLLHRTQHGGGLLWRLHAVHHNAPRLYWLNSARAHPLDSLLTAIVSLGPLVALGASEQLVALVLVFQGAHALLQHSNIDVRLGPLNWLLSMAEVHRWHHSRNLEEANANYGQTLLVWDVLLGTRRVPPGEPPTDTGLTAMPWFPSGFLGQVLAPIRWRAAGSATPP
jgi:sterol desaturase/sphingolipid hydroxylase (fatty acid hydroxylase superfamily)